MGAASEWANRLGPQWPVPGWLAWPGTPVIDHHEYLMPPVMPWLVWRAANPTS